MSVDLRERVLAARFAVSLNMAIVRHFALNLVRAAEDKRSIKLRRKLAGWSPDYLNTLLNPKAS